MLREIPGYENYLINESGSIIGKGETKLLRFSVDIDGFMYVHINGNIEYIHDLVAKSFLPMRKTNMPYIVHKDGDILNNHITNIEYSDLNIDRHIKLEYRTNHRYTNGVHIYEVYNEKTDDIITCIGREEVAKLIQYELISLKNMVGNGRVINLGPYKGYQIRKVK